MNFRTRLVFSILLLACTLLTSSGCALFQHEEPQKIKTVTDWMKQDRPKP